MNNKPLCFFVIGPESTGSTYISQILNKYLNNFEWDGRGWNDNLPPLLDKENEFTKPINNIKGTLVCHRSIPFDGYYPPIKKWINIYDCKFIFVIRDINCSHKSRINRWGNSRNWEKDSKNSLNYLKSIQEQKLSLFYFSYETLIFTKNLYLDYFYNWVDKFGNPKKRYYPNNIKDQNKQYIK